MRRVSFNNDIKFALSLGSLMVLSLLRIENGEHILIIVALSHVDIADLIPHQQAVFSFFHVVHHFVFVVGVDMFLIEFDEGICLNVAAILDVVLFELIGINGDIFVFLVG
jgi:hypothetical protein